MARLGRRDLILDRNGIQEIMQSKELGQILGDLAKDISNEAGQGHTSVVDYDRRKNRVISMVLGDSFQREADTGALARAVGSRQSSWQR